MVKDEHTIEAELRRLSGEALALSDALHATKAWADTLQKVNAQLKEENGRLRIEIALLRGQRDADAAKRSGA